MGHAEGASGVVSLIKIITMMQGGYIPPQASHSKMSHHINVAQSDMMQAVTSLRPWAEEYKVALINNYGASGSNASMVVTQPPHSASGSESAPIRHDTSAACFPFWVTGLDARSITAYGAKLSTWLESRPNINLADMSFDMSRQSIGIAPVKPERPVILCFGGQVSTLLGLDRKLWDSTSVLRSHLDHCNGVIQSLGLSSIHRPSSSRPVPTPLSQSWPAARSPKHHHHQQRLCPIRTTFKP